MSKKMFGTNTAYNFVDKDPICALLATACKPYTLQEISDKGGGPVGTLWGIIYGPTISPRYCTVARVVNALGIVIKIGELPRAKQRRRRISRTVKDIMRQAANAVASIEK